MITDFCKDGRVVFINCFLWCTSLLIVIIAKFLIPTWITRYNEFCPVPVPSFSTIYYVKNSRFPFSQISTLTVWKFLNEMERNAVFSLYYWHSSVFLSLRWRVELGWVADDRNSEMEHWSNDCSKKREISPFSLTLPLPLPLNEHMHVHTHTHTHAHTALNLYSPSKWKSRGSLCCLT